jgi:hypothetical protein
LTIPYLGLSSIYESQRDISPLRSLLKLSNK